MIFSSIKYKDINNFPIIRTEGFYSTEVIITNKGTVYWWPSAPQKNTETFNPSYKDQAY
jgi:hypothetical protein